MKVVIGLFSPEGIISTIRLLVKSDFSREALSTVASAAELPQFLEGDQETAAVSGATVGAVTGGATGALGAAAASTIPGLENLFVTGLMTTSVGGVIGAYLGSLYGVRAESQTEIDLHEELEAGKVLLVVRVNEGNVETAVSLLKQKGGEHVEVHELSNA